MKAGTNTLGHPALAAGATWKTKALWLLVSVGIPCGILWEFYPLADARHRLERIPMHGLGFIGKDELLSPEEQLVFARASVVNRAYSWRGREFFLTVVDGTRDRHAVHDPRYCFQGAGWTILAEMSLPMPGGEGRWLRISTPKDRVEVVFWFSERKRRYASLPWYWWRTTWRRMTLGHAGDEPVMVLLQTPSADAPDWPKFLQQIVPALHL